MTLAEKFRHRAAQYRKALAGAVAASAVDRAGLFARAAEADWCAAAAEKDELDEKRKKAASVGRCSPRGIGLKTKRLTH